MLKEIFCRETKYVFASHVGVLYILMSNFHMQSRRRCKSLLIESEDGRHSVTPFRSSTLPKSEQQLPPFLPCFKNAGPFTSVVDRAVLHASDILSIPRD
jgi:hypothetical protein